MTLKRPESPKDTASTKPKQWGFYRDGKFAPKGDHNRVLTEFIRELVMLRRASEMGPAEMAKMIREAGHEAAFGEINPSLKSWDEHVGYLAWPGVFCSTSAAEIVKRAGYGVPFRWCDCGSPANKDQRCPKCLLFEGQDAPVFRPEVQAMLDAF